MITREISLARIGNSRGIRIPAQLIRKHGFDSGLLIQDRGDSVILHKGHRSPSGIAGGNVWSKSEGKLAGQCGFMRDAASLC